MQVDAILIPAATPAVFSAARTPSTAPSSFSATLASSMSAPEHSQDQPSVPTPTAKLAADPETKLDTNTDSKSVPAGVLKPSSTATFNSWNLNSKSALKSEVKPEGKPGAKSDAKLTLNSATVPGTMPSPISLLDTASPSLTMLLSASSAVSLTALLTLSTPVSAPVLNVVVADADPSSNQAPLKQQLTKTVANVTTLAPVTIQTIALTQRPMPNAPMPLSSSQTVALPSPTAMPSTPRFSIPANGLSPRNQPVPTAIPAATSTVASPITASAPLAAASPVAALPTSNFSEATDVLPTSSAVTAATSPVVIEAGPKPPESPSVMAQAASEAAPSFRTISTPDISIRNISTQSAVRAQFQSSPVLTSTAPATVDSLTPVSPTLLSQMPANVVSLPTASTVGQSSAPIPADTTSVEPDRSIDQAPLDQSPIVQPSIVQPPIVQPPPSVSASLITPGETLPAPTFTQIAPSTLPNDSPQQPVPSSAFNVSPLLPTNPAPNIVSATASGSAPNTTLPAPVSDIGDVNVDFAPATQPTNAKQPAATKSSDLRVNNSAADNSTQSSNSIASKPAVEPAPPSTSSSSDVVLTTTLSSDASTATAAQTSSASKTGFATANNFTDNVANSNAASLASNNPNLTSYISNPALNSDTSASALTSMAATARDVSSNAKLGVPTPSTVSTVAAASQTTAADKKLSAAAPLNATPSNPTPSPGVPNTMISTNNSPAALTTPPSSVPAAPLFATTSQAVPTAAPEPSKVHQMLDSAPPAPPTVPAVPPISSDPAAAAQVNAQMHVGVRTDAFGAVEIHTVVQQSQIGITVHSDRDIARWFSSEIPGLESGLNNSHLNLTGVNFDSGRSGVQTATSFQNGQSQQGFSQTPNSPYAPLQKPASSEQDTAQESATVDILPSDLSVGSAQTHVSIHA